MLSVTLSLLVEDKHFKKRPKTYSGDIAHKAISPYPTGDCIMIDIINLTKTFNGHPILNNLNLTIESGEITALVGKNGAGY